MPIRTGRWEIDWHQRAIHIQEIPDPNCDSCHGDGGWWDTTVSRIYPDPVTCHCTDNLRHIRIPLWRRRPYPAEEPF